MATMADYEIKCKSDDVADLDQRLRDILEQDVALNPDGRQTPERTDRYQCRILSGLSESELRRRLGKGGLGDCTVRRLG